MLSWLHVLPKNAGPGFVCWRTTWLMIRFLSPVRLPSPLAGRPGRSEARYVRVGSAEGNPRFSHPHHPTHAAISQLVADVAYIDIATLIFISAGTACVVKPAEDGRRPC